MGLASLLGRSTFVYATALRANPVARPRVVLGGVIPERGQKQSTVIEIRLVAAPQRLRYH